MFQVFCLSKSTEWRLYQPIWITNVRILCFSRGREAGYFFLIYFAINLADSLILNHSLQILYHRQRLLWDLQRLPEEFVLILSLVKYVLQSTDQRMFLKLVLPVEEWMVIGKLNACIALLLSLRFYFIIFCHFLFSWVAITQWKAIITLLLKK